MKSSLKPGEQPVLTPREIYDRLGHYVIGQERARRAVAIAAYNHLKRCSMRRLGRRDGLLKKSNILMIGPTGSGKTHIARNLADILSVPMTIADATEFTEAGYYGKDVEVMVAELLFKANHSIEETQRGIIFIDEVDKIARRTQTARTGAGSRDIGGEGVQQALLKLLEGREIFVPLNVTQHWNKHDFVQVDTTDILFVCAGTFSDLHDYKGEKPVGFGQELLQRRGAPTTKRITLKDLLDFGMMAEFLGRLPVVVQLDALGADELFRVMTEPPDALLKEYRQLFEAEEIDLNLSDNALHEIAGYAIEKKLGARALRALFEEVMSEHLFLAPERRGEKLSVDAGYVKKRLVAFDTDLAKGE